MTNPPARPTPGQVMSHAHPGGELFTTTAMLEALEAEPSGAAAGAGRGLYRSHYLAHGSKFWGHQPGSAVRWFADHHDVTGWSVLDIGAGTGKNTFEFARRGAARVVALEIDSIAIRELSASLARLEIAGLLPENVVALCKDDLLVALQQTDAVYDCVVSYGVLHVFKTPRLLRKAAALTQDAVRAGGYLILQSLTAKYPAPAGQPELEGVIVGEDAVRQMFREPAWNIEHVDTSDITHSHAEAGEFHRHGSIRVVARKKA
jgi:SAM-dependent methyltransferase